MQNSTTHNSYLSFTVKEMNNLRRALRRHSSHEKPTALGFIYLDSCSLIDKSSDCQFNLYEACFNTKQN